MNRRRIVAISGAIGIAVAYGLACLALSDRSTVPEVESMSSSAMAAALPPGFLLGTATSAHQIEGGNDGNDWAAFESEPGRIARGERSGRADDHWNRVASDIELMKQIGANSYRFSIEWSRVEPSQGAFDEDAFRHYRDEVEQLAAAGIAPIVTLLHFTLPKWLAEHGGLTAPEFPETFARFAAETAKRLGPAVTLYCTINEPNVAMYNGYVRGTFPPGKTSNEAAVSAFAAMVRGHGRAADAIRKANPAARIGVAVNLISFEAKHGYNLLDLIATRIAGEAYNWSFLDSVAAGRVRFSAPGFPSLDEPFPPLSGSLDFVGVNYYRRDIISFAAGMPGMVKNEPGGGALSDLGWEIYPKGLLRVLREAHRRYHRPLYVTENGIADAKGTKRASFVRSHLAAVAQAEAEGLEVRGYFYWSLFDNFEWADGFEPRFGLYRIDYSTLNRTAAPGAETFREIATSLRR